MHLEDRLPGNHPFARLAATLPGLPERPEPWLLGSSPQSAVWAAELGLPYSFADFDRRMPMLWLAIGFAVLLLATGRLHGSAHSWGSWRASRS